VTRTEELSLAIVLGALATPIVAAALGAAGLLTLWAFVIAAVLVAAALTVISRRHAWGPFYGVTSGSPLARTLWLLLGALAAARMWGLAVFMMDTFRPGFSALWIDPFYIRHNCFSPFWFASKMISEGRTGLYNLENTQPYWIGIFKIDDFIYPLPMLLHARLMYLLISKSFFTLRTAWFVVEMTVFATALISLGRWLGGEVGRRFLWLTPALFLATPVLLSIQIGNIQLVILALSMMAMVAFDRGRPIVGGAMLSYACFKIFPGILVFVLILQRRWRDLFWTSLFGLFYLGLTFVFLGHGPWHDFVTTGMGHLASGSSWWFLYIPELKDVAAINQSIPGLAAKAAEIMPVADIRIAIHRLNAPYALILAVLAVFAAFRMDAADKLTRAQVWMGLLALAALQSPFVPDVYALTAPIWLWALFMPRFWDRPRALLLCSLLWIPLTMVLPFEGPLGTEGMVRLVLATVIQLFAVSIAGYGIFQRMTRPEIALVQETA
jgi:hypothetical protein